MADCIWLKTSVSKNIGLGGLDLQDSVGRLNFVPIKTFGNVLQIRGDVVM